MAKNAKKTKKNSNATKVAVPSGYRTIGGALKINENDQVLHLGKWKKVTNSIGLTVSQAKTRFPKAIWARRIEAETSGDVAIAGINRPAETTTAGAVPAGYVALAFGSIKQAGDMFLSEDNTWKAITKSVGKRYTAESKNRVVRRVVATVQPVASTASRTVAARTMINPVVNRPVAVADRDNRFRVGQSVVINGNYGNRGFQGRRGVIVHTRPSRNDTAKQSYFLDLSNPPEGFGCEAFNCRGEFLTEA